MGRRAFIRGVGLGILGGLIGTLLMDLVMMATFVSVGEPADLFFSSVGDKFGGGAIIGVGLHNIVGVTGGILFATLVLTIESLAISNLRRGVLLGLAAGAITIPVGCIPLALWLGGSLIEVIAFSTAPHLIWGATVGAVVGYGLLAPTWEARLRTIGR